MTKLAIYRVLVFPPVIKNSAKTLNLSLHELKLFVRVLMLLLFWRATPEGASTLLKKLLFLNPKLKMSTQTDTVRYELMVIVSPDIGETAIKKRVDAIKKSLTDAGGEIFFEDIWGLRDLAYSIRKHDQGFYAVLDVNLDPSKLKELERTLRLETEVLRHLVMKLPAIYQPKTQAQMETELQEQMPEEKKDEKGEKKPRMVRAHKVEAPVEAPKAEVKEAKPVKAVKKEETQEEAPKKAPKKKEEDKKALEDIDAKLDSILSNPDINF